MGIKVLYTATKSTSGLYNYEKSLDKFDYNHTRLGKGLPWTGFRVKIKAYMEACMSETPNSIVVLTDADDVLAVKSQENLLDLYFSFGKPIIVSTETICLSHCCKPIDKYWDIQKQPNKSSYKYANSGTIIGVANELYQMYKWIYDNNYEDDQIGVCEYIQHFPEKFYMDVNSQFFLVYSPQNVTNFQIQWDGSSISSMTDPVDKQTCSPFFVHFAGNFVLYQITKNFLPNQSQHIYNHIASKILDSGDVMDVYQPNTTSSYFSSVIFWTVTAILLCIGVVFFVLFLVYFYKTKRLLKKYETTTYLHQGHIPQ